MPPLLMSARELLPVPLLLFTGIRAVSVLGGVEVGGLAIEGLVSGGSPSARSSLVLLSVESERREGLVELVEVVAGAVSLLGKFFFWLKGPLSVSLLGALYVKRLAGPFKCIFFVKEMVVKGNSYQTETSRAL